MASKNACGGASSIILSVTVNLKGKTTRNLVQNNVRQFRPTDTWYDVYEIVTEAVASEIPRGIDETFEKVAKVKVTKANGTETFSPSPYDMIKIVHDFDKNLKYVNIDIEDTNSPHTDGMNDQAKSAFDVLMRSSVELRKPNPIPTDKARYNGKLLLLLVYSFKYITVYFSK